MEKAPPIVVTFQKDGKITTGLGYLRWHGGRPWAADDPFVWDGSEKEPIPIPLDARQIERDPNAPEGDDRYIHHGVVVLDQ
jgi:hypothetical protein